MRNVCTKTEVRVGFEEGSVRQTLRINFHFTLVRSVSRSMGHPQPTSQCSPGFCKCHQLSPVLALSSAHMQTNTHTHTHTHLHMRHERQVGWMWAARCCPRSNQTEDVSTAELSPSYQIHITFPNRFNIGCRHLRHRSRFHSDYKRSARSQIQKCVSLDSPTENHLVLKFKVKSCHNEVQLNGNIMSVFSPRSSAVERMNNLFICRRSSAFQDITRINVLSCEIDEYQINHSNVI